MSRHEHLLAAVPVEEYHTAEQRWMAVTSRDRVANKAFYYGVVTTRIFCRPTCPGRVARKANVIYFDDLDSARSCGYRACKRCKPEEEAWDRESASFSIIAQSQTLIDQAVATSDSWRVEQISSQLGITTAHLHRLFKKHLNMTPKEFGARHTQRIHSSSSLCDSTFSAPNEIPARNVVDEFGQQKDLPQSTVSEHEERIFWEAMQTDKGIPWTEWVAFEYLD